MCDFCVASVSVRIIPHDEPDNPIDWQPRLAVLPIDVNNLVNKYIQTRGEIIPHVENVFHGQEALELWFEHLCEEHDLTYWYSDDGNVWRRGEQTYAQLTEFSKRLPRNVAVKIWNKVVDLKMRKPYNEEFHWKE